MYTHIHTHIVNEFKNIKGFSKLPDRKIKYSTEERIKLITDLLANLNIRR